MQHKSISVLCILEQYDDIVEFLDKNKNVTPDNECLNYCIILNNYKLFDLFLKLNVECNEKSLCYACCRLDLYTIEALLKKGVVPTNKCIKSLFEIPDGIEIKNILRIKDMSVINIYFNDDEDKNVVYTKNLFHATAPEINPDGSYHFDRFNTHVGKYGCPIFNEDGVIDVVNLLIKYGYVLTQDDCVTLFSHYCNIPSNCNIDLSHEVCEACQKTGIFPEMRNIKFLYKLCSHGTIHSIKNAIEMKKIKPDSKCLDLMFCNENFSLRTRLLTIKFMIKYGAIITPELEEKIKSIKIIKKK